MLFMEAKLSIWSYYYYELTAEEAVKEFKKHGINCFELSDEHGAELLSRGNPRETGEKFREFLKNENFTVKQGHLWLSCKLVTDPEAVERLQKDCAEYFTEPPEDTSQWKWSGSEGELSCTASYYFHPGFELWLPSEITLNK